MLKKSSIAIILLMMALTLSLYSCKEAVELSYEFTAESLQVLPGRTYNIALSAYENGNKLSEYTPSEDITYEINEGWEFASYQNFVLTVNNSAPYGGSIVLNALDADDIIFATVTLTVTKIAVAEVHISADSGYAYIGTEITLSGYVTPDNSTYPDIEYELTEGSGYAALNGNSLTVSGSALADADITVRGTADGVTADLTLVIKEISVTDVTITPESETVMQGGRLEFNAVVLPDDATNPEVTYSLISGDEFGEINSATGELTVYADAPADSIISVAATAGGVASETVSITVIELELGLTVLTADKYNVEIGGVVQLIGDIMPYAVYGIDIVYEVVDGISYCILDGSTLTVASFTPDGTVIYVEAYAENAEGEIDGTRSDTLEIAVFKIDVTSIQLATSDNTVLAEADTEIIFGAEVYPENASYKTPQYIITSGSSYASVDPISGIVTVKKSNEDGIVNIVAYADGVYSNSVTFTTLKYYYTIDDADWEDFNISGSIFGAYRNVRISIKDLPEDAALTTVVIPKTVKRLIIEGAYSFASPNTTKNLFFYFHQAADIEVTLKNAGIEITQYSANNVLDFPEDSTATIYIEGDNLIRAGNSLNPYDYAVDGVYDTEDEDYLYRKHGMDGYNGADGATAINGNILTFRGTGNLRVEGGDGAAGSNGGDGSAVPAGSAAGSVSGNGGNGGSGGDAGYAIYGYNVTFNMSVSGVINAYAGNAAQGGLGGSRGATIVGGVYGSNGIDGIDGSTVSPVAAYNTLSTIGGYIYYNSGSVSSTGWTAPPSETINALVARMEATYYVDMHVKSDLYAPYSDYPMTQLTDDNSVLFILRVIDNVLSKYPDNIFREIGLVSTKKVNIYVVNTIKSGSVAGLASSTYNYVWLAYSTAGIRNIFYSDIENFTFHELTHILMYNASSSFSAAIIQNYNGGYSYVSTGSPTGGVYNLENGYTKTNSYFLTPYSRRNSNEDACETVSMIARQGRSWDFMETGAPIRDKMLYLCGAIEDGYDVCSTYRTEYWERLL